MVKDKAPESRLTTFIDLTKEDGPRELEAKIQMMEEAAMAVCRALRIRVPRLA
jgi:hypothetical protein